MIKKIIRINLVIIFVAYAQAYGGFTGPSDVLSTTYGNSNGQVGLQQGDSGDEFPWKMAVSPTGKIAICDEVNDRVSIFKSDGSFERNINILSTSVAFDNDDSLYFEAKFRKFDKNGTMIFVQEIGFDDILITLDNKVIGYDRDKKTYTLYSSTGQLIKTSTTRPLELGRVKSEKMGENNYKITVTYLDKVYSLSSDRKFTRYVRDTNGFVCGVNAGGAWRFNQCGKLIGTVLMPGAQINQTPRESGGEPIVTVNAEYGQPVIAPNGDVYTWKRTPDKYSILKWTWVDDPNVPTGPEPPTGLTLTPSINGLYLTWQASPNDPGCVTKYEIARSTTSGGVFSTIDTVEKGVLKYNDTTAEVGTQYYYKVRAMAGSEYSKYTSEVSGKR